MGLDNDRKCHNSVLSVLQTTDMRKVNAVATVPPLTTEFLFPTGLVPTLLYSNKASKERKLVLISGLSHLLTSRRNAFLTSLMSNGRVFQ